MKRFYGLVLYFDKKLLQTEILTSKHINGWTGDSGVDYCDDFISCLDSNSDGTHSLQRIHC